MRQNTPGAMIKAPLVPVQSTPNWLDCISNFLSHIRRANGGIFEGEQVSREAIEIVDRSRTGHRSDRRCTKEPVRGDDKDCSRFWKLAAQGPPRLRETIQLQRVHRTSVANEQSGH